jgi:predicted N-acetyltransferase YhbS
MLDIRPMDPIAEAGELIKLWNRRIGAAFPLDERLFLQQLRMERGKTLCVGAFDGREAPRDSLVGFALGKAAIRPDPEASGLAGYLSSIIVDESVSRSGVGESLLSRIESWLRGLGAASLHLGGDTYHFFPGLPLDESPASRALDAFLLKQGFRKSDENAAEDLIADLGRLDLAALAERAPLARGYRFSLYEDALRDDFLDFLSREFPGRWHLDAIEALDAGMRGKDIALLREEASGRIVGFSRIYDDESPVLGPGLYWRALMGASPGALGPIGVSKSVRGKGLGLALLRLSLQELAARGVRAMVIDWTDLTGFYSKMGFGPWKAYRYCSKELS